MYSYSVSVKCYDQKLKERTRLRKLSKIQSQIVISSELSATSACVRLSRIWYKLDYFTPDFYYQHCSTSVAFRDSSFGRYKVYAMLQAYPGKVSLFIYACGSHN